MAHEPFPPQKTCLLPADSGRAVAVVIERHMCSCCAGEGPDPGRDADCRAAARGGKTVPGWLPWLASCVTRTCGSCAVMSSPASRSVAVAGRSAARRVPAGQLRDRSRLPGLRPDRGRIAGAGQGARPQPGVTAAPHRLGNQCAHVGVQRGRSKERRAGRQIVTDVFGVPSTLINDRRRTSS